jgi:transposase-like protein
MIDFKGSQFEKEIILWGVRWYVAYPISYRQLEEMMGERGGGSGSCHAQSLGHQVCPGV